MFVLVFLSTSDLDFKKLLYWNTKNKRKKIRRFFLQLKSAFIDKCCNFILGTIRIKYFYNLNQYQSYKAALNYIINFKIFLRFDILEYFNGTYMYFFLLLPLNSLQNNKNINFKIIFIKNAIKFNNTSTKKHYLIVTHDFL